MSERKRYHYIDYTKGIGILLILFAHVSQYFKPMHVANSFAVSFHVPIFFVASGLLMGYRKDKDIDKKQFLLKRARVLLIPYVIFSILNSVIKFSVLFVTHSLTTVEVRSELIELCITGNGTVWFLMTLFITENVYVFCFRKVFNSKAEGLNGWFKYAVETLLMIAFFIAPYLFKESSNPFFIVGIRVVAAMGYYMLGVMLVEAVHKICTLTVKFLFALFFTVSGVTAWIIFGVGVNFFEGIFNNISGMSSAIMLSLAFIAWMACLEEISKLRPVKRFFDYFGRHSLIVMLIHPTILMFFMYPFGGMFMNMAGVSAIVVSLSIFVFTIVAEIPFIWFINKYIPFVIGKRKQPIESRA